MRVASVMQALCYCWGETMSIFRIAFLSLLTCFAAQTATAKYCVKLPTCKELGYIFDANKSEGRRFIRCPFDTNKVLLLDYCQGYGLTEGQCQAEAGNCDKCNETDAEGNSINTGYYRYTRCNTGFKYQSGDCVKEP